MAPALQAFLVAFGVVFLAELPDKTMFATIVLATRYRRPLAVVIGVTLAMAFHSVLAVAVGEALRRLPRTPTQLAVAAVFVVGGLLLLRGAGGGGDGEVRATPVHSAWGVIGRSALVIGVAEFGDFTQLATVGIVADRGYPVVVAAGSLVAHILVAVLAVLAGRWLERRLPVRTVQRAAGLVFMFFGALTAIAAIRG
ncbi:MAG: TMEM165/GDT1 family protein [Actinomycetota bacterium]|nr:TMEM165/GDT1 family protein [Actinomycetota bacterium]